MDGQPGDGAGPHLRRLRGQPRLGRGRPQRQAGHGRSSPTPCKWLWKDWPAPRSRPGAGSPQLKEILIPGEGWQLVGEGYKFTEGPAANAKGEVFFNDIPESKTWKVGLDGAVSPYLGDSKKANGQAFGPDGRLYSVATGDAADHRL